MRSYKQSPYVHANNGRQVNTPVLNVKAYSAGTGAPAAGVKLTATSKVNIKLNETAESMNASGIVSTYTVSDRNSYLKVCMDSVDSSDPVESVSTASGAGM